MFPNTRLLKDVALPRVHPRLLQRKRPCWGGAWGVIELISGGFLCAWNFVVGVGAGGACPPVGLVRCICKDARSRRGVCAVVVLPMKLKASRG